MAVKTAEDKIKVVEIIKKRATTTEKTKALVEKRSTELEAKQNETNLKLAEAASLNLAQVEELADLGVALKACENKWYNEGFADAKEFCETNRERGSKAGLQGWLDGYPASLEGP